MSFKKRSPAAYNDVKTVMDLAVNKPGLEYHLSSVGRAVNFKQRCNLYRNLLRSQAEELAVGIPGYRAQTAYDILIIRQVNAEKKPDRHGCILIFEHHEPEGKIIDPETGEEIHVEGVTGIITESEE